MASIGNLRGAREYTSTVAAPWGFPTPWTWWMGIFVERLYILRPTVILIQQSACARREENAFIKRFSTSPRNCEIYDGAKTFPYSIFFRLEVNNAGSHSATLVLSGISKSEK
jgi:hypothetical protein